MKLSTKAGGTIRLLNPLRAEIIIKNKNKNMYKLIFIFLAVVVGIVILISNSSFSDPTAGGVNVNLCSLKDVYCEGEYQPPIRIIKEIKAIVYAYNSDRTQTDSTPFTTASGQRTRHGIVANNCLPFGTKVNIRGVEYEVQDKMNSRYGCEVFDIWMSDYKDAKNWGKQYLEVYIINP